MSGGEKRLTPGSFNQFLYRHLREKKNSWLGSEFSDTVFINPDITTLVYLRTEPEGFFQVINNHLFFKEIKNLIKGEGHSKKRTLFVITNKKFILS